MHKFWDVPELVLELADLLNPRDRSSLVRSGKRFWTVAGRLWATIPSVSPLLELVTTDWSQYDELLGLGDLALVRFNLYSPFVKDITSRIEFRPLRKLMHIKDLNRVEFILPSLLHARVCVNAVDAARLYDALPASLLTLALHFGPQSAGIGSDNSDFIMVSPSNFPSLASLDITIHSTLLPQTCEAITSFVKNHEPSLQTITFDFPVEPAAATLVLTAISNLPNLREFTLGPSLSRNVPSGQVLPAGYANLRALHTFIPSFEFLRGISSKVLQTFSFHTFAGELPTISEKLEAFDQLEAITITFVDGPLAFTNLVCLANCQRLRVLHLELQEDEENEITNSELATLTKSWPELRTLKMETTREPFLTLRGLECLAENCPRLETLHITVDATGMDNPPVESSATSVTELTLRWSMVDQNVSAIANFIGDMWPNRKRGGDLWEDGMVDEDYTLGLWEEILPAANQRSDEWHSKRIKSGL